MKSTSYNNLHIAIIMDGNGRWAAARGLPRLAGHRAGADAVRRAVEAARALGVGALTLYAFSSDNWKRPPEEVSGLMQLFRAFLEAEKPRCIEHEIRLEVIGRRDRLDPNLTATIAEIEYDSLHSQQKNRRSSTRPLSAASSSCASRSMILRATPSCGPHRASTPELM